MADINNSEDLLDVRDIIARVEELETELQDAHEGEGNGGEFSAWLDAMADNNEGTLQEAAQELKLLGGLLEDLCGYGGDEQWRGDWYPVTLIRDSYFEDYAREMVEEFYSQDMKGFPSFIEIDWEATARNVRMDYSAVEYEGVTYWYR